VRQHWQRYWLVDPLDGTKEFIKRNGEFTVNIALIENGKPVLGVVYAPVMKVMYSAEKAKRGKRCGVRKQIQVRDARPPLVVISRSHGNDPELQEYLEQLGEHQTTSIGSSLKFCLVAEGQAQLYPRFGPTSTWDTAAGHAVAAPPGRTFTTGRGVPWTTPRVNRSSTPASGSLFIEQLVQQGDHLLHLFLAERAVFSPLYAAVFIQHHDRRTLFIQLPGFADHAVAVDDKLRPG
jgi:3'(2'),5'-bisphosphate nucleotidase